MGHQNAVVIPQVVLAKLMGCSVDTVQRAVRDLVAEKWISVVRLGRGKEAAYMVNDRVAWGQSRDQLRLSVFSAAFLPSTPVSVSFPLAPVCLPPLNRPLMAWSLIYQLDSTTHGRST